MEEEIVCYRKMILYSCSHSIRVLNSSRPHWSHMWLLFLQINLHTILRVVAENPPATPPP